MKADVLTPVEPDRVEEMDAVEVVPVDAVQVPAVVDVAPEEQEDHYDQDKQARRPAFQEVSNQQYTDPLHPAGLKP